MLFRWYYVHPWLQTHPSLFLLVIMAMKLKNTGHWLSSRIIGSGKLSHLVDKLVGWKLLEALLPLEGDTA